MLHGANLMHIYVHTRQAEEDEDIWVQKFSTVRKGFAMTHSCKLYINLSFEEEDKEMINC